MLARFSGSIGLIDSFNHDPILADRHLQYRYHKALYDFTHDRIPEGLYETLRCLSLANQMKKYEDTFHCISLFEKYREHASVEQLRAYRLVVVGEEV
ncbi:hypothetical protein [Paenibacillus tyrfis]|uniref:hypothetical protein n=1 Tax=Paenibacillus tyrfis TaxID=1501230 RepID=UPI00286CD9AD|nr:hypothetical protein [Paenibacillus tyrfis]